MASRRILVVYYSRTGTTRKVAEALATELGADLAEIVDRRKRGGPLGFVVGGKDAALKKLTEIDEPERDAGEYDLVVIGTPVWANTICPAIRTYVTRGKDRLPAVAFFLTTGGSGAERTFRHLGRLCGKEPVATLALLARGVKHDAHLDKVRAFAAELSA